MRKEQVSSILTKSTKNTVIKKKEGEFHIFRPSLSIELILSEKEFLEMNINNVHRTINGRRVAKIVALKRLTNSEFVERVLKNRFQYKNGKGYKFNIPNCKKVLQSISTRVFEDSEFILNDEGTEVELYFKGLILTFRKKEDRIFKIGVRNAN